MKNRLNLSLLIGFILSLAIYLILLVESIGGTPHPYPLWLQRAQPLLLLGFHAVPFFFLQLLLCRASRQTGWTAVPLILVAGAALVCGFQFYTSSGWDFLGWGVLLLGCAAPAAGCILGWSVYGMQRLWRRERNPM